MKKKFVFVPAMVVLFVVSPWASESSFADADPPTPGTFTIAILPDTQKYSQSYPAIFTSQTQWIVDQKALHNIVFVLHEGDITNNNNTTQWVNADTSMSLLDGNVPYALALGNHDMGTGSSADTRDTMLNSYFPVGRFENLPTFGGVCEPGKMDNSYHLFSAGGMDWLILALEFGPRDPMLDWANQVVADYPNRNVIVVTHCYMYHDDTLVGPGDSANPHNYGVASEPGGVNDGDEMWDKFVRLHPNISFVFSGHILGDGKGKLVGIGDNGNKVYQMLANYQMLTNGGNGYLRLVEFDVSQQKVRVKTYSPYLDQHLGDSQNQFEFVNVDSLVRKGDYNRDGSIDWYDLDTLRLAWLDSNLIGEKYYIISDDFESYDNDGELEAAWYDFRYSPVQTLETGVVHSGSKSMKLDYSGADPYVVVEKNLGWPQDWTEHPKVRIWFKGSASNPAKDITLTIRDSGMFVAGIATVAGGTSISDWTALEIDIDPGNSRWQTVQYIQIMVSAELTAGTVYLDDMELVTTEPQYPCSGPLDEDLNEDCQIDLSDFAILARYWFE